MADFDIHTQQLIEETAKKVEESFLKIITEKESDKKATKEELKKLHDCLVGIKIQLNNVENNQNAFIESRKVRSNNCDMIQADHENRLRDTEKLLIPTARCEANELKLDKLITKTNSLLNFKYKLIGAALVISIIIPSVIGTIIAVMIKDYLAKHGIGG